MRLVKTPDATVLTGLSTATLREWTSRRALIPADVPPKGKGSPAGFTWQTILLLRIAVTLRDRFHLELQPHRSLFASLRRLVQHLAQDTARALSHAQVQDRLDEHEGLSDLRRDLEGILAGSSRLGGSDPGVKKLPEQIPGATRV